MAIAIHHAPGEARLPAIFLGKAAAADDGSIPFENEIFSAGIVQKCSKIRALGGIKKFRNIAVKYCKTRRFIGNYIGLDLSNQLLTTVIR
jgi:hypothetical protein